MEADKHQDAANASEDSRLSALEAANADLQASVSSQRSDVQALQQSDQAQDGRLAGLESVNAALAARVQALEERVDALMSQVGEIQQRLGCFRALGVRTARVRSTSGRVRRVLRLSPAGGPAIWQLVRQAGACQAG